MKASKKVHMIYPHGKKAVEQANLVLAQLKFEMRDYTKEEKEKRNELGEKLVKFNNHYTKGKRLYNENLARDNLIKEINELIDWFKESGKFNVNTLVDDEYCWELTITKNREELLADLITELNKMKELMATTIENSTVNEENPTEPVVDTQKELDSDLSLTPNITKDEEQEQFKLKMKPVRQLLKKIKNELKDEIASYSVGEKTVIITCTSDLSALKVSEYLGLILKINNLYIDGNQLRIYLSKIKSYALENDFIIDNEFAKKVMDEQAQIYSTLASVFKDYSFVEADENNITYCYKPFNGKQGIVANLNTALEAQLDIHAYQRGATIYLRFSRKVFIENKLPCLLDAIKSISWDRKIESAKIQPYDSRNDIALAAKLKEQEMRKAEIECRRNAPEKLPAQQQDHFQPKQHVTRYKRDRVATKFAVRQEQSVVMSQAQETTVLPKDKSSQNKNDDIVFDESSVRVYKKSLEEPLFKAKIKQPEVKRT